MNHKALVWLAVAALLLAAILFRFQMVTAPTDGGIGLCWRLDRWTGRVEWISPVDKDRTWNQIQEWRP